MFWSTILTTRTTTKTKTKQHESNWVVTKIFTPKIFAKKKILTYKKFSPRNFFDKKQKFAEKNCSKKCLPKKKFVKKRI